MRKGFFARLALMGIRKNRKVYYPYLLTAVITVAMLYIICSLSMNPSLNSGTLAFSLQLGVGVTTCFSVIFLFYTNSFLMKRRKKEFGLYNILGMEKKHIGRVVAWETILILLASLAAGFGIGLLLEKLMFLILTRMIGEAAALTFHLSAPALGYAGTVVGLTFLTILLNSLRQIHLSKPIELLRGGEVGEREPRAKWVLALLGVLALGAGYWISVSVSSVAASIMMFFVAVMLVIAGTYLLFTAGSITTLKLLRKSKRYYYRADHFISVSGMIYRMKQNAVGLANVCILSTMVLVMVFSTCSLWFGMEDTINNGCLGDVDITLYDYRREDELRALLDEELRKSGLEKSEELSYSYLTFAAYQQGDTYLTTPGTYDIFSDALSSLFVIPLEEYNRLNGTKETLASDEILLSSLRGEHRGDTLSVLNTTFRIKKRFEDGIPNGPAKASIYPTQFMVVSGWEPLLALYEKQEEAYGERSSSICFDISFRLSGDKEEQGRFYQSLRAGISGADPSFGAYSTKWREELRTGFLELYGGLLFIGLFLGALFIMAMILIVYYKQISEGYDDRQRYQIMQKVGLSRSEIKRSIGSQILTVFFLPLLAAGIHVAFAFPMLTRMFSGLGMFNVTLMAVCALASFAAFAILYGVVYILTAKVYYRIVSE